MDSVQFYRHDLGKEELRYVSMALKGLFLTAGPLTRQFEEQFASYLHCRRVIGTYSCTTALFLCLKALDIGPGDEVITTPMTFIATPNAVLEAGATPVFVDVEKATGNLDARLDRRGHQPQNQGHYTGPSLWPHVRHERHPADCRRPWAVRH